MQGHARVVRRQPESDRSHAHRFALQFHPPNQFRVRRLECRQQPLEAAANLPVRLGVFAHVRRLGRPAIVAFSGRALPDIPGVTDRKDGDKPAKYINSPESPIYTKGQALFGLHAARSAIRADGRALVVEGNFDLLQLVARGFANVVASSTVTS